LKEELNNACFDPFYLGYNNICYNNNVLFEGYNYNKVVYLYCTTIKFMYQRFSFLIFLPYQIQLYIELSKSSNIKINEVMKNVLKISLILIVIVSSFGATCQSDTREMNVQNLETFARMYGYARWFHPSDEAQEIDWDKFAILGVQKVKNVKTTEELRDTLYRLFSPIVQGLQIYEVGKKEGFNSDSLLSPDPNAKLIVWQHHGVYLGEQSNIYKSIRTNKSEFNKENEEYIEKMFENMPQFGEVTRASIGNGLICVVPLALLSNGTSTYPKTDLSTLTRLQSELTNMSIDRYGFNLQVNLASVIIAWNVLQHFFPYFDVIDTDWSKVLGETLESTLGNKQKTDFFMTLSQMFAQINDGHGVVFGEQMYYLPIRTEFLENKIVVTASSDTTLKRGDIIHKIDEKPAVKALEEKEKMISGSPQLRRYRALNIWGSKYDLDETNLVIERDGKEQNIPVAYSSLGNMFFNSIDERRYISETIVELESGIYYINMANCTANEFEQKKDILANAKAVIYDQRGGSRLSFFEIVPYWIEEPVTSAWWNVPQTIYPDRKEMEFDNSSWDIQPMSPLFKSRSIIINVPSVVSAGETMMSIIDHYNLATTVGESTAGCNGNINIIVMPCGYYAWFTGMKVLKHDGSQLYRKGFEPDYPVKRTIQTVKEGRDQYMDKALEIARQD